MVSKRKDDAFNYILISHLAYSLISANVVRIIFKYFHKELIEYSTNNEHKSIVL